MSLFINLDMFKPKVSGNRTILCLTNFHKMLHLNKGLMKQLVINIECKLV